MLASITPLGERGRGRRWGRTVSAYVVGSVAGGLVVGVLAAAGGALLLAALDAAGTPLGARGRFAVLAVVVGVALVVDLLPGRTRAPGPRRQVNEDWLDLYREWVYGAGFGLQLGSAVLTQVSTAAVWAMLAAAALTGSVAAGAVIGVVFGAARALPVLATRSVVDPPSLARLHGRTAAWSGRVRTAGNALLAVTTAALVVAAAGGNVA